MKTLTELYKFAIVSRVYPGHMLDILKRRKSPAYRAVNSALGKLPDPLPHPDITLRKRLQPSSATKDARVGIGPND